MSCESDAVYIRCLLWIFSGDESHFRPQCESFTESNNKGIYCDNSAILACSLIKRPHLKISMKLSMKC